MENISVIMTTYNLENYAEESIKSVIKNLSIGDELIIVDDHSTDKTRNILSKYKEDTRVKIIFNKKNCGVSKSRNIAISEAVNPLTFIIDGDDMMKSSFLDQVRGVGFKKFLRLNYKDGKSTKLREVSRNPQPSNFLYETSFLKQFKYRVDTLHEDAILFGNILDSISGKYISSTSIKSIDRVYRDGSIMKNKPIYLYNNFIHYYDSEWESLGDYTKCKVLYQMFVFLNNKDVRNNTDISLKIKNIKLSEIIKKTLKIRLFIFKVFSLRTK